MADLSGYKGFVGSITDIPTSQFNRLSLPCFTFVDESLAIVHGVSKTDLLCVLPEYGAVKVPLSIFDGDDNGARFLFLQPGRDTQQKKLTFRWFIPQLKSIKSLSEVLIALLVLQLLNLAQPLVMQQIFDKVIVQQNLDTLYTRPCFIGCKSFSRID